MWQLLHLPGFCSEPARRAAHPAALSSPTDRMEGQHPPASAPAAAAATAPALPATLLSRPASPAIKGRSSQGGSDSGSDGGGSRGSAGSGMSCAIDSAAASTQQVLRRLLELVRSQFELVASVAALPHTRAAVPQQWEASSQQVVAVTEQVIAAASSHNATLSDGLKDELRRSRELQFDLCKQAEAAQAAQAAAEARCAELRSGMQRALEDAAQQRRQLNEQLQRAEAAATAAGRSRAVAQRRAARLSEQKRAAEASAAAAAVMAAARGLCLAAGEVNTPVLERLGMFGVSSSSRWEIACCARSACWSMSLPRLTVLRLPAAEPAPCCCIQRATQQGLQPPWVPAGSGARQRHYARAGSVLQPGAGPACTGAVFW